MLDYRLAATDGEMGRVQDFLFDDETWIVHHLVVQTGTQRDSAKVMIAPAAVWFPQGESECVHVFLTRDEVWGSARVEPEVPVSVQHKTGLARAGSHLRSMREVLGYSIRCPDGEAGTIGDFIIEDTLWGVHHVIVALRTSGAPVLLPPESIRLISWQSKNARVNLSLEEIEKSPGFEPSTPVNHDTEHRL